MIKIEYVGMFGNNLFTYTYSRILAERFGRELISDLPPNGYLRNTPNKKGILYNTSPLLLNDRDNPSFITPDHLENKTYIINGFFQNIDYYTDIDYIKSFFEIPVIEPNFEDLVVHIRLSDYKNFGELGTVLNPDYYIRAINEVNYRKLYIVTDEPSDSSYLKNFDKFSPIIISNYSEHDFLFLMKFKKIIISNSTFSWWAAFLGAASEIYSPSVWLRYCNHVKGLNKIKNARVISATWI